jgi:hypothetical protein
LQLGVRPHFPFSILPARPVSLPSPALPSAELESAPGNVGRVLLTLRLRATAANSGMLLCDAFHFHSSTSPLWTRRFSHIHYGISAVYTVHPSSLEKQSNVWAPGPAISISPTNSWPRLALSALYSLAHPCPKLQRTFWWAGLTHSGVSCVRRSLRSIKESMLVRTVF